MGKEHDQSFAPVDGRGADNVIGGQQDNLRESHLAVDADEHSDFDNETFMFLHALNEAVDEEVRSEEEEFEAYLQCLRELWETGHADHGDENPDG